MRAPGPILLFDSGVGGLSVAAAVRRELPDAQLVYAADNAGYPYGTRSEAEIATRVPALLGRLVERFRPALVVIACNTASTIALAHVRAALDLPIVGTVPAIKPAATRSRTRVIGVLGTDATVRQPYVARLSAEFAADCHVLLHGSAALVDLAERKLRGLPPDLAEVRAAVAPLLATPRLDTIVLACTHFPLLADELRAVFGPGVALVDGSAGIARRVRFLLGDSAVADGTNVAVFTRLDAQAEELKPALAAHGLTRLEQL